MLSEDYTRRPTAFNSARFPPGDVMLADALYCNDFLVATMLAAGVDVLFEQNGARHTDFRWGVSLGARDHLVRWTKSKTRPEWMSAEPYAEFPDALTVREVMVDGQILVTTLVNHRNVRKGALDRLYAQRWNVELDLRNILVLGIIPGRANSPCAETRVPLVFSRPCGNIDQIRPVL